MTEPVTISSTKVLIQLLESADPDVFGATCGITTKGIQFTNELGDTVIVDCDDPQKAWLHREHVSSAAQITGTGTLAMEDLAAWRQWFENGKPQKVRFALDLYLEEHGGYWEMVANLAGFTIGAERGTKATIEVDIQSTGEVVWTDAAAAPV